MTSRNLNRQRSGPNVCFTIAYLHPPRHRRRTRTARTDLHHDLHALSEQAPPEQDFERQVHQRFVAAERAVLAG